MNVASILGQVGWANGTAYAASKHGVVRLTRTAALDYAAQGLRVNAVGPGFIETPIPGEDRQALDHLAFLHSIGLLGFAEETASLIVFLSSSKVSLSPVRTTTPTAAVSPSKAQPGASVATYPGQCHPRLGIASP